MVKSSETKEIAGIHAHGALRSSGCIALSIAVSHTDVTCNRTIGDWNCSQLKMTNTPTGRSISEQWTMMPASSPIGFVEVRLLFFLSSLFSFLTRLLCLLIAAACMANSDTVHTCPSRTHGHAGVENNRREDTHEVQAHSQSCSNMARPKTMLFS